MVQKGTKFLKTGWSSDPIARWSGEHDPSLWMLCHLHCGCPSLLWYFLTGLQDKTNLGTLFQKGDCAWTVSHGERAVCWLARGYHKPRQPLTWTHFLNIRLLRLTPVSAFKAFPVVNKGLLHRVWAIDCQSRLKLNKAKLTLVAFAHFVSLQTH